MSVGSYWSDYSTSYRVVDLCSMCVLACMAFPLPFFPFLLLSFIPSRAWSNRYYTDNTYKPFDCVSVDVNRRESTNTIHETTDEGAAVGAWVLLEAW